MNSRTRTVAYVHWWRFMVVGMRASIVLVLLGLGLAGCTAELPARQADWLPPGVFGTYEDNDVGAINFSAWAFASPANTSGNPVNAARAVVAIEYLGGELKANPRWVGMDPSVKDRLVEARDHVRSVLGVRQDAPSQLVVNAMLMVVRDMEFGDRADALRVLSSPMFTYSPEQTLQMLSNLPYIRTANLATSEARDEEYPPDSAMG